MFLNKFIKANQLRRKFHFVSSFYFELTLKHIYTMIGSFYYDLDLQICFYFLRITYSFFQPHYLIIFVFKLFIILLNKYLELLTILLCLFFSLSFSCLLFLKSFTFPLVLISKFLKLNFKFCKFQLIGVQNLIIFFVHFFQLKIEIMLSLFDITLYLFSLIHL